MLLTFFFTFPQFAVYRLTRWVKKPFAGKRLQRKIGEIPLPQRSCWGQSCLRARDHLNVVLQPAITMLLPMVFSLACA